MGNSIWSRILAKSDGILCKRQVAGRVRRIGAPGIQPFSSGGGSDTWLKGGNIKIKGRWGRNKQGILHFLDQNIEGLFFGEIFTFYNRFLTVFIFIYFTNFHWQILLNNIISVIHSVVWTKIFNYTMNLCHRSYNSWWSN